MRLAALVALMMMAIRPAAADPSITLNQPNPVYGQTVNFTAVYPREARLKVGTEQHNNPAIQVDCYQAGVHVFRENQGIATETNNHDGTYTGVSGDVVLGAGGNENTWTGGAATCYATLFYFGKDHLDHILATTSFDVAA